MYVLIDYDTLIKYLYYKKLSDLCSIYLVPTIVKQKAVLVLVCVNTAVWLNVHLALLRLFTNMNLI